MPDTPPGGAATYFNGQTARAWAVLVRAQADGLVISGDGLPAQVWPLGRLRRADGAAQGGNFVLALATAGDAAATDGADSDLRGAARLVLHDPALVEWVQRHAPNLTHADPAPGTMVRLLWRAGAAAVAMLGLLFVILPRISDQLALSLSPAREAAFGRAVVAQMAQVLGDNTPARQCDTPAGRAALQRLMGQLAATDPDGAAASVVVLDSEVVNAFAVPGRQIVLLRGLLDDAKSADELAGVLSHEMGHIAARDPIRLAFRTAGSAGLVSLIIGDVTGGTLMALMADQIMQAGYTREAEAAADDHAFASLSRAGLSSVGLANFFDRLAAQGDDLPAYLSTHPQLAERAARARQAAIANPAPALAPQEWAALRGMCD